MTVKKFKELENRKAAIRKLERIAQENLRNTIRLLKYNRGENIRLYRFSSRLIPLAGHELLEDWDYLSPLKLLFQEIGEIIQATGMRVGFHPDHFTLLNSVRESVFHQSVEIIKRHVAMLELMNLSPKHRNVIHIGGKGKDKDKALERFISRFKQMQKNLGESIIIENDDKTFTTKETLYAAEKLRIPMVLDLHHDWCNPSTKGVFELWPDIMKTWEKSTLPPKIHISSPKSDKDIRAHADFIDINQILPFLLEIKSTLPHLDVMIEAKQKDNALFDLMNKIVRIKGIEKIDESTIQIL